MKAEPLRPLRGIVEAVSAAGKMKGVDAPCGVEQHRLERVKVGFVTGCRSICPRCEKQNRYYEFWTYCLLLLLLLLSLFWFIL